MSSLAQLYCQLRIIVNFSVEDDAESSVFVRNRLLAA